MAPLHLPQEIITEIMHRLPLRSLLRCKLLSKQLKNLISDPKFYTLYKDISRTVFFDGRDGLYCASISDADAAAAADDNKAPILGPNVPPFTVHLVLSHIDYPTKLIGCSHGIACLQEVIGSFLFYNLFTGSLQTVAYPPQQERFSRVHYYGFGYDYYGDDYKIVFGCDCYPCWIYSYRNKEWNSVKGFPYEVDTLSGEVAYSFNGVLHWAAITTGDNIKKVIATYDLHTNRFGEIQVPPLRDGVAYPICSIMSEFDGQLCYVCTLYDQGNVIIRIRTAVWVMKEYGVGDSWESLMIWWNPNLTLNGIHPNNLLYKVGDGGCGRVVLLVYVYGYALILGNIDHKNNV